jgi:hypothetical protein
MNCDSYHSKSPQEGDREVVTTSTDTKKEVEILFENIDNCIPVQS